MKDVTNNTKDDHLKGATRLASFAVMSGGWSPPAPELERF